MSIETCDSSDLVGKFIQSNIVFRITSTSTVTNETRDVGMVTSYEDYSKKISTHLYLPILFLVDFYIQLAYLYGCLNLEYGISRKHTFTFWWRNIGETKWSKWFIVHPYEDKLFVYPN